MKTLVIAGGTGFLGQLLEHHFLAQGYRVILLSRRPRADHHVAWDGKTLGPWTDALEDANVLINLCGKSVDCRYTDANREVILRSRIDSTQVLGKAIADAERPPALWLNASSATIYVHAEHQRMTEEAGIIGDDFSMSVCREWEEAFFDFDLPSTRQVALRTSIVLGHGGGAYPKIKSITRLGGGGYQGSGRQWMSWIHATDFCRALDFIMNHQGVSGAVNVTAPHPVRNRSFMQSVRSALNVPFGLSQPAALLELGACLLGTETELLLKSRHVYPERLLTAGFTFRWGTIEEALRNLENPSDNKESSSNARRFPNKNALKMSNKEG